MDSKQRKLPKLILFLLLLVLALPASAQEKKDRIRRKTERRAPSSHATTQPSENGGPNIIGNLTFPLLTPTPGIQEVPKAQSIVTPDELSAAKALLPSYVSLPMTPLLQYPELPTGCESVALTIALKSLGFELEKETIASDYLVYNGSNFALGYVGDPFTEEGAGVFPPGLVLTANAYLESQGSSIKAYDATGMDFDSLLTFLAQGKPVIMWVTTSYTEPMWSQDVTVFDSNTYRWYWNEHCVAICGYDLKQHLLYLQDPLKGTIAQSLDDMRKLSEQIGGYAIVLF